MQDYEMSEDARMFYNLACVLKKELHSDIKDIILTVEEKASGKVKVNFQVTFWLFTPQERRNKITELIKAALVKANAVLT